METGIYVRVSTEEQAQEGFSVRAQEQKLKDFARIKDWSIYKIYIDEGISGKNLERPAMQELIADINNGAVQNVLVFKIDRLTRSTADLIYLVDLFNERDCAFNSLMESIDTQTASGRMFLKIIGIFAEFERENIIERTKVGIERKVREGYSICGTPSYGYDRPKNQKIQTINEEEAEVVRSVFDMYVNQGMPITGIARQLNVLKIPTKKANTWESTGIKRLLSNCNYVGNVRHHLHDKEKKYSVEGLHEQIISQEIFDSAQRLLAKNRKISPKKKPRPENYFSGFLECALCGYKMRTHNSYKLRKDGTVSMKGNYICPRKTLKACTAVGMSHKKVEQAFSDYMLQIDDLDSVEDVEVEAQQKRENLSLIKAYEEKLRQLDAKERDAMSRYVNDEMAFDSYREIKKMVDKEKERIYAEMERLRAEDDSPAIDKSDLVRGFRENWDSLSSEQRRQFLLQFVDKILVKNEVEDGEPFGKVTIVDAVFRLVYADPSESAAKAVISRFPEPEAAASN
ncbi:MAG: recombinase family protein [Clostridia bacterium]|nr:recombinase family protein [Clostridia bacterium]